MAGVVGQSGRVALPADRHLCLRQLRPQQGRCQQAVAAIVARSAGDPDPARMGLQRPGQGGDRMGGALHQVVRRQAGERGPFYRPARGAAVQREWGQAAGGI